MKGYKDDERSLLQRSCTHCFDVMETESAAGGQKSQAGEGKGYCERMHTQVFVGKNPTLLSEQVSDGRLESCKSHPRDAWLNIQN